MKILILNGPNLKALGIREPHIYGNEGLSAIPDLVKNIVQENVELIFFQSNSEGALIDRLELAREEKIDGVVLNAGAYTHTSLALADCLAWIELPCVEIHLSNVMARKEDIRKTSYIAQHVIGIISGFGIMSYALGVQAMVQHIKKTTQE